MASVLDVTAAPSTYREVVSKTEPGCVGRKRGKGCKLKQGRLILDTRRNFFTGWTVRRGEGCPDCLFILSP